MQVNGKLRGRVTVPPMPAKRRCAKRRSRMPNVQKFVEGKPVRKFVYVPGKLANVVV